jgi:hypothetical protein
MNAFPLTAIALLLGAGAALAQNDPQRHDLRVCASPPGVDFRHADARVHERSNDTLWVGLQVHIVGKDDGTMHFPAAFLLDAFCQLNTDFDDAGLRFYFRHDWHYLNNTAWRQHTSIPTGIAMMQSENAADALNIYLVANAAGACGYNLPYAGVALAGGCLLDGEHTWAHEAGHALSLPHTFLGWEGKTYDAAEPTPAWLAYDHTYFHEFPDTIVPATPDTALVERTGLINCTEAADLFCSTPPDYLSAPWPCDAAGQSLTVQHDPAGMAFQSDGTLFMSYAAPACQTRFTDEQIAAMRAFLPLHRPQWLGAGPWPGKIAALPELTYPPPAAVVPAGGFALEWFPVAEATYYLVEVATNSDFFPLEVEAIVTTPALALSSLAANTAYHWRVRPFNAWDACTGWSEARTFATSLVSTGEATATAAWRVFPTVLRPGQPLTVSGPAARAVLYDSRGERRWQGALPPASAEHLLQLPAARWEAGLYRLVLDDGRRRHCQPLLIMP